MSTEAPQGSKEMADMQAVAERAAVLLAADAASVFTMYHIHDELIVIKTISSGFESDIFTTSFRMTQEVKDNRLEKRVDRLDDIGRFAKCSLTGFISESVKTHPGVGIVLDKETAKKLTQEKIKKIALIDYGDKHCLLTGLSERGIDVYLAPDIEIW